MVILPVLERVTRAVLVRRGFESRHVDTPVSRVHLYDARGEGHRAPVVLLHGIGASSFAFVSTFRRLRKTSRRVLALDAPGHGLSSQPLAALDPETFFEAIAHVLDRELDAPALVVGNSLGGAMALRYALRSPDRVAGLVLTSPGGAPVDDPDELRRFLGLFELASVKDAIQFLERLQHDVPWYGPLLGPDLVRLFKNPAVRSILSNIKPEHFFAPGELSELKMPIHVLWGKSDRIIPTVCLEFFKKNLPASTIFEEPEGIGHSPHMEDPRRFLDVIERSLARIDAEKSSS